MIVLSPGASKIMGHLARSGYQVGDYMPASRLFYMFDDQDEKQRCLDELVACGFVAIAPNLGVGITPDGERWNGTCATG